MVADDKSSSTFLLRLSRHPIRQKNNSTLAKSYMSDKSPFKVSIIPRGETRKDVQIVFIDAKCPPPLVSLTEELKWHS